MKKKIIICLLAVALFTTVACGSDDGTQLGSTAVTSLPSSGEQPVATERSRSTQQPTSTGSTTPVEPSVEQPDVVLSDVHYACGPTDEAVIQFEVIGATSFTGRAELVVLDEARGSTRVRVSPVQRQYLMDISISGKAFEVGEGHLRVTSDNGRIVASAPVTLRLPQGVACG